MFDVENEHLSVGQKRPALQVGPRKKSYVDLFAFLNRLMLIFSTV